MTHIPFETLTTLLHESGYTKTILKGREVQAEDTDIRLLLAALRGELDPQIAFDLTLLNGAGILENALHSAKVNKHLAEQRFQKKFK